METRAQCRLGGRAKLEMGSLYEVEDVMTRTRESGDKEFAMAPSAAGAIARLAYARAKKAGITLPPLLSQSGLTVAQIENRHLRLNVKSQITFLRLVADALGDSLLGFHLAHDFDLREIGPLYYVMTSSDVARGRAAERRALQSNRQRRHFRGSQYRKDYDHQIEIPGRRASLGPPSGRVLADDDHPHLPTIDEPTAGTEPHTGSASSNGRATAVGSVFRMQSRVWRRRRRDRLDR